jgi:DNA invertase Pin-like site-specific DNA recombinase
MTRYVALVCRISKDKRGRLEGVEAQEKWGRTYAASAWPDVPIEVFADNDISAANGDHRPEFERFREWLAAGKVVHLWAVEQSRLERREVEWFRLAAELDAAGITELHTNRDGIVRVRDEVAGIKAVLNAGEVRRLKSRINDRLAENAAKGLPAGSKPFGYEHSIDADGNKTYAAIPEQAEAIRWAADRVLSGWSLTNIANELTARGLQGAHGGRLSTTSVKGMLTNPTVAGHRVHQGRIVGPGNWPAILPEDTWQAVRAKLSASRVVRRKGASDYAVDVHVHTGGAAGRRYLLTGGLAVCDICKAPLLGTMKQVRSKSAMRVLPYLICHPNKGGRGCIGVMLERTEQHVVDELFKELDKPDFLNAIASDNHAALREKIASDLAVVERKRNELAGMWNLPPGHPDALTTNEWQTARRAQAEQEQELRAAFAEVPPPVIDVDIDQARAAWPDMTLDEQREFVRLFVELVTVKRAKPGTKGFDSNRIDIGWRAL